LIIGILYYFIQKSEWYDKTFNAKEYWMEQVKKREFAVNFAIFELNETYRELEKKRTFLDENTKSAYEFGLLSGNPQFARDFALQQREIQINDIKMLELEIIQIN